MLSTLYYFYLFFKNIIIIIFGTAGVSSGAEGSVKRMDLFWQPLPNILCWPFFYFFLSLLAVQQTGCQAVPTLLSYRRGIHVAKAIHKASRHRDDHHSHKSSGRVCSNGQFFFFRKERERLNYKSAVYHREEKRNIICNKSSIIDAGKKQTIVGVQKTNTHQTNCNRARHNLYGGRRIYKNGASIILTQCVTHTQMHFCFLFFFIPGLLLFGRDGRHYHSQDWLSDVGSL